MSSHTEENKLWKNKQFLMQEYHKKEKSAKEIAEDVGVHYATIYKELKKKNIKTQRNKCVKIVSCEFCGSKFERAKSKLDLYENHFCSKSCHNSWMRGKSNEVLRERVDTECKYCEKNLSLQKNEIKKRNFCSNECLSNWMSKNFSGKNSPAWKGGSPSWRGSNWETQRQKCLERDDYQCQKCGISKNLHVHHIKPVHQFNTEKDDWWMQANKLGNLLTLCKSCHFEVHSNEKSSKLISLDESDHAGVRN